MFVIEFSEAEHHLMAEILDYVHRDLKEEIYKTEDRDFKTGLREREHVIEAMMAKLADAASMEPAASAA